MEFTIEEKEKQDKKNKEKKEDEENKRMILKMTTYSTEEVEEMLNKYDNNVVNVIRHYMNLPIKQQTKTEEKICSINQEKYRQIRHTLDRSMKEYRDKTETI